MARVTCMRIRPPPSGITLSLSSVSSSFALSPPVSLLLLLLLLLFPPLVGLMGISCSVLTVPMYGGGGGQDSLCIGGGGGAQDSLCVILYSTF